MKYSYYLIFTIIIGCNLSDSNKKIFIGGHIINPSSKYIALFNGDKLIDSLDLDLDNKFILKYDSLPPGIYKLEHPPQNQTLLIEPGDSIWVRVNTKDFDSSISYSGIGAAKNNFLIDTYLQLKNETSFLSSKYSFNSDDFSFIIDSLLFEKKKKWMSFDSINNLSPFAQKIIQSAYIYPYANRRERYALIRGNNTLKKKDSINYFSFRKYLSLGEEDLSLFEPYIKYIMSYISNQSLDQDEYFSLTKDKTIFNIRRLKIIDKQIPSSKLRSTLFRSVAYHELVNFKNHKFHQEFINFFNTLENGAKKHVDEIISLYKAIELMQPGNTLPIIKLEDSSFVQQNSSYIFNDKLTVIYFWSQTQINYFKNTYELVLKYQKKFPNYRFVGICIQPLNSLVLEFQEELNISTNNQYSMVDFEKGSKKWVLTVLNKGIIIDERGVIKEGFGVFTSKSFETDLLRNSN